MIKNRYLPILMTCLFMLILSAGLGLAASKDQFVSSSAYLPLVFKESTFKLDQLGFIGVDENNYANTYIYKINEDGSGLQNLTVDPTPYLSFSWSPDGSKIAFNSFWAGNDEIYVMNADGSVLTRLTYEPRVDEFPAWSPDGTRIAFSSDRQGSRQIYVMGADGSTVTRLTNLATGCSSQVWSPDGSRIAFDNFGAAFNNEEIYVVNPDGTGLLRLTNNTYFDTVEGWSPDGSKILFRSNRDSVDSEDVYVMNKDGTGVVRLTTGGHIQTAAWSPNASKIAYTDFSVGNGLYVMDPDGTNKTEVLCQSDHIAAFDLYWSPDSKKIAYSPSSGSGIYIVRLGGDSCFQLTSMLASSPKWIP